MPAQPRLQAAVLIAAAEIAVFVQLLAVQGLLRLVLAGWGVAQCFSPAAHLVLSAAAAAAAAVAALPSFLDVCLRCLRRNTIWAVLLLSVLLLLAILGLDSCSGQRECCHVCAWQATLTLLLLMASGLTLFCMQGVEMHALLQAR
jgi:hypothetical protein